MPQKTMKDYAVEVLLERNKIMNVKDIIALVIAKGYITNGKTPEATLQSLIGVDIKNNGDKSRFSKPINTVKLYGLNTKIFPLFGLIKASEEQPRQKNREQKITECLDRAWKDSMDKLSRTLKMFGL